MPELVYKIAFGAVVYLAGVVLLCVLVETLTAAYYRAKFKALDRYCKEQQGESEANTKGADQRGI